MIVDAYNSAQNVRGRSDYLTGGNDARHLRLHADALAATGNPAAAQSLRQRAERLAAGKR